MKQERKEELIVRWMDNELLADERAEMNTLLEAELELGELRASHESIKSELHAAFPPSREVPYGDFFRTKLEQAIRESELEGPVKEKAGKSLSWRDALRWWLAPVAVGAMAVAFLAGTRVNSGPNPTRTVVATVGPVVYTPEGGVTANFVDAEGSGTSVIVLDGLPPIPDSYDLMAGSEGNPLEQDGLHLVLSKKERRIY